MTITTAPALLIGIGARILLDYFSRQDGPFVKDYILAGAWQGVALHYAAKTSKTSGFGIIVAFLIAAKLFIEFNLMSDLIKCITTVLGVVLGILLADFLSQYFDKSRQSPERRRKQTPAAKSIKPRERVVQFRPSVEGGSVETTVDITEVPTSLATSSHLFSDITSVDSNSDKPDPTSSMSALEREVHLLRTRASLADSERRRFKEERKWAISQGNMARASQMKWEVKRYTSLMQTFNREADLKALELENKNVNGHSQSEADEQKLFTSKDRLSKPSRDPFQKTNVTTSNGRPNQKFKRSPNGKVINHDAGG